MWSDKYLIKFIKNNNITGIILSGSNYRILDSKNKRSSLPYKILKLNIPILGICYGYQWLIKTLCGNNCIKSFKNKLREYDKYLYINKPFRINKIRYHFKHFDYIKKIPNKWKAVIKYEDQIWMVYYNNIIGVQFHPERYSKSGKFFYKKWIKHILIKS